MEALGSPAASLAVEAQVSVADRERDSGIPAAGLEQPQPQAASGPKKLWNWTKWSAVRDAALAQLEAADLVPNSEVRSGQTAPSVREPLLVAPTMLGADASTTQRSRHAATLAESADDKAEASGSTVGRRGRTVDDQATLLTTGGRSAPNAPAIGGEPVGPSSAPMPQATFPAEVEGANEAGTFRTEAAVPSQPMGGVEPEQASSLSTLQAGDRPVRRAHPEVATHKPVEARSGVASPAQGAEQVVPEQADGSSVEPAAPGPQEPEALWPSTEAPAEQPRTDTVRGVSNTGATPASPAVTQAPSVTQPAVQSPATQADGAPALDGRTLRQLSDRVLLLATSRRKDPVVVRLEPRDLGLLTITISQDQNRVEATVAASNEQVRVALQHSAPALQQSLETRGLQLASLSIEAQTSGFGGFGDRAGQPNQSPQQQPLPFRFAEAAPEAARREAGFETPSADKAVDYRI
ncbi:MAG: flagellar hook-length control protein FliK [Fimbriimonadaceae bacterium]